MSIIYLPRRIIEKQVWRRLTDVEMNIQELQDKINYLRKDAAALEEIINDLNSDKHLDDIRNLHNGWYGEFKLFNDE